MVWRGDSTKHVAACLLTLFDQINQNYPGRSTANDGTIGDDRHQGTHSDHNPDDLGIVRAIDITHDPANGFDSYKFADFIREHWDDRVQYIISNSRIANIDVGAKAWRPYSGSNPHDHHVHISARTDDRAEDSRQWDIAEFLDGAQPNAPTKSNGVASLDQKTIDQITTVAASSDLARVNWGGRGRAPIGYIKGMAVCFALCLQKLAAKDSAALAMVRVVDSEHDVFDHYAGKLQAAGLETAGASDTERLLSLFVILTGLGMRESSGRYCEGRDRSASNTSADTAEAGLFQQSWDSRRASLEIAKLLQAGGQPNYLSIFQEGVTPKYGDLDNYGSGDGEEFQALCKASPAFAVQCAAIGLRTLYTHWGPIIRQEADLRQEAKALFERVEGIVGANSPIVAQKPVASWVSVLIGALMALFRRGPSVSPPVPVPTATDLASRIVAAMKKRGMRLDTAPGQVNTVYVEGMGPEGDKNDNRPNEFNDARFVIGFDGTKPRILGAWEATTTPGRYWTENPMNSRGAAMIKMGQYTAWQVGMHHTHEALVQTGGNVTVYRDLNADFKRDGDKEDTGQFGINQHWGYDLPKNDLGRSSAGCLVGRMKSGHKQFMTLMKSDPRYIDNHRFVFTAAVLPASEV